jgi:hypothetical protein
MASSGPQNWPPPATVTEMILADPEAINADLVGWDASFNLAPRGLRRSRMVSAGVERITHFGGNNGHLNIAGVLYLALYPTYLRFRSGLTKLCDLAGENAKGGLCRPPWRSFLSN